MVPKEGLGADIPEGARGTNHLGKNTFARCYH